MSEQDSFPQPNSTSLATKTAFKDDALALPREDSLARDRAKAPYRKYALVNPYNITLLLSTTFLSVVTFQWWLIPIIFSLEILWLLFAPDSRLLQKVWFDKIWNQEKAEDRKKQQIEKFEKLTKAEKTRSLQFRELQRRIEKLAQENSSLSMELLRPEISRLEDLVDDFLDLSLLNQRYSEYLKMYPLQELEKEMRKYELQMENLPKNDERWQVAQRNHGVLVKRKEKHQDLRQNVQVIQGQMELMEHTFRLLADEILGMRNLSEFTHRLNEMREGVEVVRQTYQETESFLSEEKPLSISNTSSVSGGQGLALANRSTQVVQEKS